MKWKENNSCQKENIGKPLMIIISFKNKKEGGDYK